MMFNRCPSIEKLEAALADNDPKVAKHVEKCLACQGVLALIVGRSSDVETEECARAELLCAKREIAPLTESEQRRLDGHLGRCEPCRAVASDTADDDHHSA